MGRGWGPRGGLGQPSQTRQGGERCIKPGPWAEHLPVPLLCLPEVLCPTCNPASGPKSRSRPAHGESLFSDQPQTLPSPGCSELTGEKLKVKVSVSA